MLIALGSNVNELATREGILDAVSSPSSLPGRVDYSGLPGWELVSAGMDDLAAGRDTVAAMLVKSARERLASLGIDVPGPNMPDAHLRMYALVVREVGERRAHSRYNALRRRLLSFARSAQLASRG